MKKFNFLVKYSFKKRVARKAFLISNIIIGLLIIIIVNLPGIISSFASDNPQRENVHILVVNEMEDNLSLVDDFSSLLNPIPDEQYFIIANLKADAMDIDSFWLNEDYQILLHFKGNIENPTVDIYDKTEGLMSSIETQIELLMISYKIEDYRKPTFNVNYAPDYENPEDKMILSSIMSFLIVPLFILTVMATQFIGVDIIEEKSTKAIETIISSVPAKIHFLSKITSSILFIITQGALLIVYGILGMVVSSIAFQQTNIPQNETSLLHYLGSLIPNWPSILGFTILFIIFGTLLFLVLASLFASMATTQEDYQQFQTPVMLVLLAGFYIGMFAPMAGGTTFMKVMAFIPLFTPMVAPIAFASGVMSVLEAIIALIVLIIFLVISIYVVAPVYRVAILSYDQTKLFTRIGTYFKKGFSNFKNKK